MLLLLTTHAQETVQLLELVDWCQLCQVFFVQRQMASSQEANIVTEKF